MSLEGLQKPDHVTHEDWNELTTALGQAVNRPLQSNNQSNNQEAGNNPAIEEHWAEKAGIQAEHYEQQLRSINDKQSIHFTEIDDEIYNHFRTTFPTLGVKHLTEDQLKSDASKALWRTFCMSFQSNEHVKDYQFGSLLRLDSSRGYEMKNGGENVTIVPMIQFLAIEIARNREGANDAIV